MKLDALPSSSSWTDDDQENLKILLKTFGSVLSLEDIASAYRESGRNFSSAVEILCEVQGGHAETLLSKYQYDVESMTGASSSSGCTSINGPKNKHINESKQKKCSVTMGTVSDVIGKEYITPRSQSNGLQEKVKPVKLHSNDFPASEIWDEKELVSASSGESMDSHIQELLFKMLGNAFQLEMSVIQNVIGQCGYNTMSIDTLGDLSAKTLEKSDDVIGIASENTGPTERLKTGVITRDELVLPQKEAKKKDLEREILNALFSVPDRTEEKQKPACPVRRPRQLSYGTVVAKPLEESVVEDFTFITRRSVKDRTDEANQSSYDELRQAVMEYWVTMKEYYKAALDAFIKRDYEKSKHLMEEGSFYMKKAREADELSAQKIIEDTDEEELSLNMLEFEPKEALQNLKLQLTYFSGLSTIRHVKVIVGTSDTNNKDVRRKRLITRLLEKEGISWTEEGDGYTLSIEASKIDPRKLSFANK